MAYRKVQYWDRYYLTVHQNFCYLTVANKYLLLLLFYFHTVISHLF